VNTVHHTKGTVVKLHVIAVYHNTDSRFFAYEPDHGLTQVISHLRHQPDDTRPEQTADLAFRLFNVDLEHLQTGRAMPSGELDFLIASTYRLMRLRSIAIGDVVAVTIDGRTTWLACDPTGWRAIAEPDRLTGQPLTAATVYQHARRGHDD
jgi:hypothetical protein